MRQQTIDFILISLIFSLLVVVGYMVAIFDRDGYSCLADPIQYFERIKPDVDCSCKIIQNDWERDLKDSNFSFGVG